MLEKLLCSNDFFAAHRNRKVRWLSGVQRLLLAVLLLGASFVLHAQNVSRITVQGTVVDQHGSPLAGASVRIKGENTGKATDKDGVFSISVPGQGSVLVISHIGFSSKEVPVGAKTEFTVRLAQDVSNLNDVIVVGYGAQKKATLTGAVEQVTGETFESRAVTNVGLALQGETPGLLVTRTSPRPGNEGIGFQIRGYTSVNGGSPLIVIDGVPALNYYSFQNLNTDDIESISVLKDGAASIYGSRAANGVILVTTKRGKGKVKIDYSGNFRFTTPGITAYSPGMQQYASMWLAANAEEADNAKFWWGWVSQDNMQRMANGDTGIYQTRYWGNVFIGQGNRLDQLFGSNNSVQHNVSVSSRNEFGGYRLSIGYADNKGSLKTAYDGQKQYNVRLNYDYQVAKRLKVETDISLVDILTSTPSVAFNQNTMGQDMPFFPAKNPQGEWYGAFNSGGGANPAAVTSLGGRDNKNDITGRLDFKATYQFTKELALEGMASVQNQRQNEEKYITPVIIYNWTGDQSAPSWQTMVSNSNPGYTTYAGNFYYQYYSAMLKFNKSIGGVHNFSATAGINAEKTNWNYLTASRVNFTDLGVTDLNVASNSTMTNSGGKDESGLYSYIARVNYNYKEKYLVELLDRYDGNSKFASGYKFKNFFGAQAGWVFTNESFLQGLSPILSFGKIRASYGSSGNDVGLGSFDYLSTVNFGTLPLGSSPANQTTASLSNNGLISYTRTWEKVEQKNLGLDLNFLNSRLSGTFDYFIKDNIGMLINVQYPSVLGGSAPKTNSGHFNTKGWETIVGWKDTKKKFSYNISFNIANTQTLVTKVQGADNYSAGTNSVVNGYAYNALFVYKTAGYFKNQADVDAYYAQYGNSTDLKNMPANDNTANLRPGDTKKVDVAGKGNITSIGNKQSSLIYFGDLNAHYTFGLNLGVSWNGIDLSAFFQGQFKQLVQRSDFLSYPFWQQWTNQPASYLGKTWTTTHTDAKYPRMTVYPVRSQWDYQNNDFNIQNDRYIRLKSLIVGYTLPQALTRRAKLERVRIYFSGNDLWEKTSIKDGYDPEMGSYYQYSGGYPFYRTWSFGVNVGL